MAGFDHSAHAAQVAGAIEYCAGNLRVSLGAVVDAPALVETVATPTKIILEGNRRGQVTVVALTIASALFAGKRPREGDSFRDQAGLTYRIQSIEGGPQDAAWRFICGSVVALPASP